MRFIHLNRRIDICRCILFRYFMNHSNKIRHSILELATISEGKTVQDTLKDSLELAQKAEDLGYERFWLAEHHNAHNIASSATAVLIGYIAAGTKRIRVGS